MQLEFLRLEPGQVAGAQFIASRPSTMLADVPGWGKTAQCVHAFDCSASSVGLVICPPVLCPVWECEFAQWSFIGHATHIIRNGVDPIPAGGVCIVSYDLMTLHPQLQDVLKRRGGNWLFLDEAHRLKEPKAKRTKAIFAAKGIASRFDRVTWITGTPAPNDASEFYTFLKSNGQFHGNEQAFISSFCETTVVKNEVDREKLAKMNAAQRAAYLRKAAIGNKLKIVGNKNLTALKALLAPVYLRRTEVEGLPPLITTIVPVEGLPGDMAALEAATTPEVRQAIEAALESGKYEFLEQEHIATIRKLTGLAKAPGAAALLIQELKDGEDGVVAFALHTSVINIVADRVRAAGFKVGVIDGRTPRRGAKPNPADRQSLIDGFQNREYDLLLCQTVAAGEGITLTRSSRVVIIEADWTPARNDQAVARAWRRGQKRTVRASFLALYQSLDEVVFATLRRKQRLIAEIV